MNKNNNVYILANVINKIHFEFHKEYFSVYIKNNTDYDLISLSKTYKTLLENYNYLNEYIYLYRLMLHEAINDYLIKYSDDLQNIKFFYRVKTKEAIVNKINTYKNNIEQYLLNNWLNDIFGARIILNSNEFENFRNNEVESYKKALNLKNYYYRDKDGYKGLHLYFKNKDNKFFPWELQVWDKKDLDSNILSHKKFKRSFINN